MKVETSLAKLIQDVVCSGSFIGHYAVCKDRGKKVEGKCFID